MIRSRAATNRSKRERERQIYSERESLERVIGNRQTDRERERERVTTLREIVMNIFRKMLYFLVKSFGERRQGLIHLKTCVSKKSCPFVYS